MSITVNKLTDKVRFDLAKGQILTSYGDFELKKFQPNKMPGKPTLPTVPGGIFDSKIFGSPYTYRCECGLTEGQGKTCPMCHSHINTEEESLSAIGLIKSPIYFINPIALDGLNVLLKNTFTGVPKITLELLYTRFFTYDQESNSLVISDDVANLINPDFTELSIEGLIKIFEKYKKSSLDRLMELVQRYIIVRPVSMRPWSYTYKSWVGTRVLEKHQLNFQYQSLIYITNELVQNLDLSQMNAEDIVYSFASIRLSISKILGGMSDLIKTSKASSIRQGFGTRVPNSSRAVAVADPTLEIDQVSLPIGMCFEIFRDRYINWYIERYGVTSEELTYKFITRDKQSLDSFRDFVNESTLYVMINRAPTLYKLSQLVFRVVLNDTSVIGYSLMATTPLNLDFDGDTLAVYEVPEHLNEEVKSMLPSNLNRYMKSDTEVIVPKQETLIGLMIATKSTDNVDKSDSIILTDLNQAEIKYSEGLFNSNDLITIGSQITTYGKLKVESILGFPAVDINEKNISKIVTQLKSDPDYVAKMKELQEFGLEVSTFESSADLSLENLEKSKSKVDASKVNDESSIKIYGEALKLMKATPSLSDSIKGSSSSISSIVNPQLMYDSYNFSLTSDSMLDNMTATDYIRISTEFRKVQQIKVNSVGESGYLARQIWTAMSKLVYSDEIKVHDKLLEIVPDVDGFRYANGVKIKVSKGIPVKVDSTVFSEGSVIYKNDLYDSMTFKDGHLIGIDFGMQLSEGTTQGILKLKHAGSYLSYSVYGLLTAESDCTISHDDRYIIVNGSKFLKSPKFQFVDPNRSEYKKGDLVGINPTLVTPNTNLYLLMKLIKALGSPDVISKPKRYVNLYSINSGKVTFEDGNRVKVGNNVYIMPEESLCLVYEGQEVGIGVKLFTGPLDYAAFVNKYSNLGVNKLFDVFKAEINSFVGIKDFLIEVLFKSIHYIDILDNGTEVITFRGVSNSIDPSEDLLTSLTFGFIKDKISKFIASGSSDMGESTIINIAYQFNGLKLLNVSNKLIGGKNE